MPSCACFHTCGAQTTSCSTTFTPGKTRYVSCSARRLGNPKSGSHPFEGQAQEPESSETHRHAPVDCEAARSMGGPGRFSSHSSECSGSPDNAVETPGG